MVFITGASSGIGFASALLFAERGWDVIAGTRHGTGHPEHVRIRGMQMDIDNPLSVDACFQSLQKDGVTLDVLINNAGCGVRLPFDSIDERTMHAVFETNVFGSMRVTKAALPLLQKSPKATIVTIGSLAGRTGMLYHSLYAATKFAVEGWSESLRYELEPVGISVKIVEPLNRVETDFFRKASLAEEQAVITPAQSERYRRYMASVHHATSLLEAEKVAETVFRAATDGRKKLRYIVSRGWKIRALLLLQRYLPSCAYLLLRSRYKKMCGD